jgi:hypothetical protein
MKNKLIAITLLIMIAASLSSCFASRSKVGCPATADSGRRFKG